MAGMRNAITTHPIVSTILFALTFGFCAQTAAAGGEKGTARAAMALFAEHCFSPYLTAKKAAKVLALSGTSYDFYDLDPFSGGIPSPVVGRAATAETDRRCEIAFSGDYAEQAAEVAKNALANERILTPASLPARFEGDQETTLLAARRLNPKRVAVVHVGTRPGARGIETFLRVERLTPAASVN